jgi:cytochrome c oxidase cbb3-type subunit 3
MRLTTSLAVAAAVLSTAIGVRLGAQTPPPAPPAAGQPPPTPPAAPPQGRRGGGPATFPAQQRTPGDPAVIARGNQLYGVFCRSCHGPDLRGGDQGGPNLLRSQVVLNDQQGELIIPIVQTGRANPGMPAMPPLPMPVEDIRAIAEYIHSVTATARGQGAPPAGPPVELNIVVGNAQEGRAYFQAKCSACHSPTGDLAGIASRFAEPVQLQNAWLSGGMGGRGGGRGAPAGGAGAAGAPRPTTVSVTEPNGQKTQGRLVRVDDFMVVLALADGSTRSFARKGDVPKVEITNPRQPHLDLLPTYSDKDIHDVTAYLVTLK